MQSSKLQTKAVEIESVLDRYGKPFFGSLWVRAWGEQYPVEVQPFSSCTRELLRQLMREIELSPGHVLADLGCGTGGVGLWLAREIGVQLIGVDCSQAAIEIARQRIPEWQLNHRAEFVRGEFSNTGLEEDSVDAAVSIDALGLPFAPDDDAALRETRRVLRLGGRLVFTTREPRLGSERERLLGPAWRYALERNGFELVRCVDRPEVAMLWRNVYAQWVDNEDLLRTELTDQTVDGLVAEAREVGPRLNDARSWSLISAVRTR